MSDHKVAGKNETWYGVYTAEGDITSDDDRIVIKAIANAIYDDPDITYTPSGALYHESGIGTTVECWDITDLRCDGLVEYCYEYRGLQVWGPTVGGTVVNWNISEPANVDGHNDLGKDDPWRELSPFIQRGGDYYDSPYTKFGPSFPPPTDVAASDGSYTDKVKVTWNGIPYVSWYRVYRATSSGGTKTALGSWQTSTTYYDTGATPGTTYYYFVRGAYSYYGDHAGSYSSYNTGYRAGTAPPAPTNVQATDGTYTDRVRITWSASSGATSYEVYRAASSGGTKSKIGTPSGTSYDDTSASVGTTYYYWVKASNSYGTSGYSSYNTGYRQGEEPTIAITSPNGGESWQPGTSHSITWTSSNVSGYVKIELYRGITKDNTITSSTSNDGSYSWYIPSTQSERTDYRIKITSTSDTSIYDYSNSYFTITQEPIPVIEVTPSDRNVSWDAGSTTFNVSNAGGGSMSWTASVTSGGSWLSITSGSSGMDAGTITSSYDQNTGSQRTGTIRVTASGATGSPIDVTVTQSESGWSLYGECLCMRCTLEIWVDGSKVSSVGYGAGKTYIGSYTGTHKVGVYRECDGVVTAVTCSNISGSNGDEVIGYLDTCSTTSGTGHITVNGVTQPTVPCESGWSLYGECLCMRCTLEIWVDGSKVSSVGYGAGKTYIGSYTGTHKVGVYRECDGVVTAVTCSNISGSNGDEVIGYLDTCSTTSGTGHITVNGVTQNEVPCSSCTYSISPTSEHFSSSGGTGSVNVTAESGCSWSATSNDGWITITSGSSGSGDGAVDYSVSSNSSISSRTGTMTIAGLTFTVTQDVGDIDNCYVNKDDFTCGGNSPCYSNIQEAIDAAGPVSTIKVVQGFYDEDVTLNTSKTIALQGGWDWTFTTQSSNTTINSLTISSGTIVPSNIILGSVK